MLDQAAAPRWVLDRALPLAPVPVLDAAQRAVVDHPGGPLLVLAGPGTGKTTTLVEAVVERVRRGTPAEQVLVLTFSRRAAQELRDRTARRLASVPGAGAAAPVTATFHAWCLALLRGAEPPGAPPRRLLSGPERLVRVRELVRGGAEGAGRARWPGALRSALPTRGFARELADLLDRVRERGLEPSDVAALAARSGRADWAAAADFYAEYVDVLGLAGELDYGELGRQALRLLEDSPEVLAEVRRRARAVFVDEYQDTDPAQERLLALLAGGGSDLVVVGDPDQSIYAFRGAELDCLLRFPDRFPAAYASPAPVLVLSTSRRAGAALLAVSRQVVARVPAAGLPAAALRAHRALRPTPRLAEHPSERRSEGRAEVRLFATVADEAAAVADLLRREHLERGRAWSAMAVLVRSGRAVPLLRRALAGAGVPVCVAADELPVAHDPAVAPLLLALQVADAQHRGAGDARSALPGAEVARDLLLSPLGGATPAGLRRLGRALRALERAELASPASAGATGAEGAGAGALPAPSAELVRRAVEQPGRLALLGEAQGRDAEPVRRLARVLGEARRVLDEGGGAEEALWALWERSGLSRRLAAASAGGGTAGRAADRDLDAVVAAFAEVQRLVDRVPRAPVAVLLAALDAQEIPSSGPVDGAGGRAAGGAVRLLTAHRAKGLEWDVVVVAGVQEDVWPDVRRRGSLLDADLLRRDALTVPGERVQPPSVSTLLAEERRLFYVALTRARERLVVTAVDSGDEDGEHPSRFLEETGLPLPGEPERPGTVLHPLALAGRVRRALLDPATSPPDRRAAAATLARLAPHVPAADPGRWWGVRDWTPGARPVRPPDEPAVLSASAVAQHEECPLRWFLGREVRAAAPSTSAQGFGMAVHALARLVAEGALPVDLDALTARLDAVWPGLGFEAPWHAAAERAAAVEALARFLRWHAANGSEVLGAERSFEVLWRGAAPDGSAVSARLRGSLDRVQRGPDGRPVVVDLKTSKAGTAQAARRDPQLGVYQVAVREGALGEAAQPGGAELVHLREGTHGPARREQPALEADDPWADELIGRVAGSVLAERFPARVNDRCDRCPFRGSCPAQDAGSQVVA